MPLATSVTSRDGVLLSAGSSAASSMSPAAAAIATIVLVDTFQPL